MKRDPAACCFDHYLFVDWSASSSATGKTPRADAIWVGELGAEGSTVEPSLAYFPTRRRAFAHLRERLLAFCHAGRRALVGFDLPNGYPRGTAAALGLDPSVPPWKALWQTLRQEIQDDERNRNNRFQVASRWNRSMSEEPGPFWGCPTQAADDVLLPRRKGVFDYPYSVKTQSEIQLANRRLAERRMSGTQEVWKLLGIGSVGSQTLMGIPYLHDLRFDPDLERHSRVWPYEVGFGSAEHPRPEIHRQAGPWILHAEVWPGLVESRVAARLEAWGPESIRDAAQMRELCRWAAEEDAAGRLRDLFAAPSDLSEDDLRACLDEEGWILGAPSIRRKG